MKNRGIIYIALFVVLGVYWNVFGHSFLRWDDDVYVTSRIIFYQIASGNLSAFWSLLSPQEALSGKFWEYFPMRDLTYALNAYFGGIHPQIFHTTNLILHLLTTWLVWFVGRRFGLASWSASIAAACFGLHPLAVEPVAWVSGRKDLLYTFFILLTLVSFSSLRKDSKHFSFWRWSGVFLFALFALLSKGAGAIVIVLLFWTLLHWIPRPQWKKFSLILMPLFFLAVMWVLFSIKIGANNQIINSNVSGRGTLTFIQRSFLAIGEPIWAFFHYFLPVQLSPSYLFSSRVNDWWTDLYTWMMLLIVLFAFLQYRKKRFLPFPFWVLGASILSVIPSSGIISVSQYRADRFYYLFLVFFSLFLGWTIEYFRKYQRYIFIFLACFLSFWSYQTFQYNKAWKNNFTLWSYVHNQEPQHPQANLHLGGIALRHGKFDVAEKLTLRAIKSKPNFPQAWNNLALIYLYKAGKKQIKRSEKKKIRLLKRAKKIFQRAFIAKAKNLTLPYYGLGRIAELTGKLKKAEALFRKGLKLQNTHPYILFALSNLLISSGRKEEAYYLLRQSQKRFPYDTRLQKWLKKY